MRKRTIREIGGEIWAEITKEMRKYPSSYPAEAWNALNQLVDRIMGVLARLVEKNSPKKIDSDTAHEINLDLEAEIIQRKSAGDSQYNLLTDSSKNLLMKTVDHVLSRYRGYACVNDADRPVAPLPDGFSAP